MADPAPHVAFLPHIVNKTHYNQDTARKFRLRDDSASFLGALIQHLQQQRRLAARGERDIGCPMTIARDLLQGKILHIALDHFDIERELRRLTPRR